MSNNNNDMERQGFFGVFRFSGSALNLVWLTKPSLVLWLGVLTVLAGVLPAVIAYVGKLIVDSVVFAMEQNSSSGSADLTPVIRYVLLEAGVVIGLAGVQRGISICQSLLRALLGQKVNVLILEKALTLSMTHFEDSEFYDKLTRARREASSRPLSLINRLFGLAQNSISLVSYAFLLIQFSPWAVLIIAIAGFPSFFAEAKFSGDAFRLFRWRSPETRMQMYLETVLAREDHAKEVKLFQLGNRFLDRYRDIFNKLFREDKKLVVRRDTWGFLFGLVSTAAFYGAYAWIVFSTVSNSITLGEMTMYLLLFKQGQSAVAAILKAISGMYEDNLYLSNLYEFLDQAVEEEDGFRDQGVAPGDGVRFENVGFRYPGTEQDVLENVSLHIRPGQSLALVGDNGSGKTTLIKLLARFYHPTTGRILLDGSDLKEWKLSAIQRRMGVIFQDFARYQMIVGENIGVGDVGHFEDRDRWEDASDKAMAREFIAGMEQGFDTQLGRWFKDGRELSGGQWQKIALSRAFMRQGADILVLDEPTAAIDAEAEAAVFEQFQSMLTDKVAIVISHRFATVRMADHIVVIERGRVTEQGTHQELMNLNGRYAHLFSLQAAGYK
ncbi:MAG: ABC transporter ATP-binding protein [Pseudomonadota bacterium]